MRQSELFLPLRHEDPRDEQFINAKLLIRGGFIDKVAAGVYSFLPLGLRVLKRIEGVIREEINAIGGQEILLPALHPKKNWEETGRWDSFDALYKVKDAHGREMALAPTHEEIVVPLVKHFVSSWRDLPLALYQFQTKFRMELRAKSGLLRGREFLMKDLYSFHADEKDLNDYYEGAKSAYGRIFERLGLGERTYLTLASGGTFSKYSHEFQTVSPVGEDTIYLCESCGTAVNDEIIDDQDSCPSCGKEKNALRKQRAIEVGNIFPLKTKFSEVFGLTYRDVSGKEQLVLMGCYGIGLGRAMGAVVEVHHDERGIRWPLSIAPFDVHLLLLGNEERVSQEAQRIAEYLQKQGIEVLYDDRSEATAGEKFSVSDLLGIPWRLVISEKTVEKGKIEAKARDSEKSELMSIDAFIKKHVKKSL